MNDEDLDAARVREVTEAVDVEAPPPEGEPTALFVFGTYQFGPPTDIAVRRYHRGLAPLIIVSGGVNRHTGVVEAHEFRRSLCAQGVPDEAVRIEDQAADTRQNVELSRPYLREALDSGLRVTAVCKWFHRRAVHWTTTLAPEIGRMHVVSWEPVYAGRPVTRTGWPANPEGRRKVLREREESSRRVADGSFRAIELADGAWRPR